MTHTFINLNEPDTSIYFEKRSHWKAKLGLLGVFAVFVLCLLHWGGYLLLDRGPLPDHVDAAIVLQGPVASEKARVATAMSLMQQGAVGRVVFSVPGESYWDEQIPTVARQYLEKNYGADLASRVDFCQTPAEMNSTEQEEEALGVCLQDRGWKTIVLVTSNYHGRRVGMIWRKTQHDPSLRVAVKGIADPEYQPRGWWRQRRSAETWFTESTKLVWVML